MICYKGIIVCLLQISIINRPSKGYVMHFCQGMYVYMPKKKRRRVLLHLMPMNSKCIAPAITHSQRTDLIAVHLILALYANFIIANFITAIFQSIPEILGLCVFGLIFYYYNFYVLNKI